ncbi:MAG: hypothetical protein KF802_02620 [Bdellovibrionaceae bacterium]|nr:hypothetical protein [Pseudobdellovibrionaceae bacterium]
MSEQRMQNHRQVQNQYSGQNAYPHIQANSEELANLLTQATSGHMGGGFLSLIINTLKMLWNLICIFTIHIYRIPIRFYFFSYLINTVLYKPLTYFFEEYLNRNSPVLFDPHFLANLGYEYLSAIAPGYPITNPVANYISSIIGSVVGWGSLLSNLDQGLSWIVVFAATLPWLFGRSLLMGRPALSLYAAINLFCFFHSVWMGNFSAVSKFDLSTSGAQFCFTCLMSVLFCLTAYWANKKINNTFASNNLNSLGENHGGFLETLTADNNLKTPIKS